MATLRDGKNGGFYLRFRYPPGRGGKEYERHLPTDDRQEAEARRKLVEVTIHDLQHGRLTLPPDVADVGTFIMSAGKVSATIKQPTYGTLQDLWDDYSQVSTKDSTKTTEKLHFGHLLRILGKGSGLPLLTTANLQAYIRQRATEKGRRGTVKAETIEKELETLRAVWNGFALPNGLVKVQFQAHFGKIILPKKSSKPPFQTFEQIQRQIIRNGLTTAEQAGLWDCLFLDKLQVEEVLYIIQQKSRLQPWLYPMTLCAAHTGARLSELCRSQPNDFDSETATVHWREKKRDCERDCTFRPVKMSTRLLSVMQAYLDTHNERQTFPIRRKKTAIDALQEKLSGTKWERIRGFHIFRHSLASILAMEGTDQRVIDATLGHQTEEMRRRYRHLFPSQQKAALDSIFG